ncbi:MAG TPA: ATP-dependent Clp protease adaptor ClpS [Tepidisphaeraceae bacterium]|jgi:ATP-dependent Clp protease adaptor protein ClpS
MEEQKHQDEGAVVKPKPSRKRKAAPRRKNRIRRLPPFNVILLDDNEHTYEYVIEMLGKVFGYAEPKGYEMAQTVDASGRVIVMTTHKELAELKRDQILGYGADWRLERSKGPMSAVVEPAEN